MCHLLLDHLPHRPNTPYQAMSDLQKPIPRFLPVQMVQLVQLVQLPTVSFPILGITLYTLRYLPD